MCHKCHIETISNTNEFIFECCSQSTSQKPILVALNFGEAWQTIDLSSKFGLPQKLKVVVASIESQYSEGYVQRESKSSMSFQ